MWESGSGAVLDGVAALVASGLTGFSSDVVDVALQPVTAVTRSRECGCVGGGTSVPACPSACPGCDPSRRRSTRHRGPRSDRQAALTICLVVQQRPLAPERLLEHWLTVTRSRRRALLHGVIRDVCDGAHSLGELDFARLCRARGPPEPSRQVVRTASADGRVYLDVVWEDIALVVEIDGGHHGLALSPVDDALRQNEVVLGASRVLRVRLSDCASIRRRSSTRSSARTACCAISRCDRSGSVSCRTDNLVCVWQHTRHPRRTVGTRECAEGSGRFGRGATPLAQSSFGPVHGRAGAPRALRGLRPGHLNSRRPL